MGKRGPRPKPLAVHIAEGTARRDRHGEITLPPGCPEKPDWLSDVASAEWDRVVGTLVERVGLSPQDAAVLALCCEAFAEYVEYRAKAADEPIAVAESGAPYQHPYVGMANRARDAWLRYAKELGLTPSARCGMKVTSEPKANRVQTRNRA